MKKFFVVLTFILIPLFACSQPYYKYDKVGNTIVSQELTGIYMAAYSGLRERGVDMTVVDQDLEQILFVYKEEINKIAGDEITIGMTLQKKADPSKMIIFVSREVDSFFKLVVIMYHELTHTLLIEGDCNYRLLLFQPNYNEISNNEFNKLFMTSHVDDLASFIKEKQKEKSGTKD